MNTDVIHKLGHKLKGGSPAILSAVAIAGVATTAYLTAKSATKAQIILDKEHMIHGCEGDRKEQLKRHTQLVWRCYIPPAISGTITVTSILAATRMTSRRAAAAQAALVISDRAYQEYRTKVIEEYGENKDKEIRDKIAVEKMHRQPTSEVIVASGNVLCLELYTGRLFQSDIETIRRAVNRLNSRLIAEDVQTLDDFYHMIGLQGTQFSCDMGWNSDKLLELDFTSALTEDDRPCLAFEYNYVKPVYEGLFR